MITALLITFLLILLLIAEKILVVKKVNLIPTRIHVNGTRGKSSVTELIKIIYEENSLKVFAKITGVIPTLICPDGIRKKIFRAGQARVKEQINYIIKISGEKPDAFILECMSIKPEYQRIEAEVFKPHFYIITNIRTDHKEEMGNDDSEIAQSICEAIPSDSTVVTTEQKYLEMIIKVSQERNSRVVFVNTTDVDAELSDCDEYLKENILLATKVAELAGLNCNKKDIINKFLQIKKDNCYYLNNNSVFINGFAINDTPSADNFIRAKQTNFPDKPNLSLLLNTRKDRPRRTQDFVEWAVRTKAINQIILAGNHKTYAEKQLRKYSKKEIVLLKANSSAGFERFFAENIFDNSLVIGIGNIAGIGFEIVDYFESRRM